MKTRRAHEKLDKKSPLTAKRKCLRCGKVFLSRHKSNRICPDCAISADFRDFESDDLSIGVQNGLRKK